MSTEAEVQTEFKYTELSPKAQEKARDAYRTKGYPWDEWWEPVYEDMVKVCELFGIELQHGGLGFSGFISQGDGAWFAGHYRCPGPISAVVKEFTSDEVLRGLASQLDALQVGHKLQHDAFLVGSIKSHGHYLHSGSMFMTETRYERDSIELDDLMVPESDDVALLAVMRGLADWHYKQLQAEYEHLTSDAEINTALSEQDNVLYDEDGATI